MKILWSPLAIQRMNEIAQHIAQEHHAGAVQWVERIFEQVARLEDFPQSGRIVPEINRNSIREILYKNYRIVYRLAASNIHILTLRHGKQILPLDEIPH